MREEDGGVRDRDDCAHGSLLSKGPDEHGPIVKDVVAGSRPHLSSQDRKQGLNRPSFARTEDPSPGGIHGLILETRSDSSNVCSLRVMHVGADREWHIVSQHVAREMQVHARALVVVNRPTERTFPT